MTAIVNMAILKCVGEDQWEPIMPADLPDWIKDPEAIGELAVGAILEHDGLYYRGHATADTRILVPQGFVKSVQ